MSFEAFLRQHAPDRIKPVGVSHVDKTLREIGRIWDGAMFGAHHPVASRWLSPGTRVVLVLITVVAISLAREPLLLASLSLAAASVVVLSILFGEFTVRRFLGAGFLVALVFGLVLTLPATINLFAYPDGDVVWPLARLSHSYKIGPARVPAVIGVTNEGLVSAATLLTRQLASVALVLWLALTVRWFDLLRVLRRGGVPSLLLQVGAMTVIYLHLLLRRSEEAHMARRSRVICRPNAREARGWVGRRVARAWEDSLRLMEEVHQAMVSRGFRGEARRERE